MQIAQVLSGYSLGGADLLRRAMGKKIKEEMDQQRDIFVDGAVKQGVDKQLASSIFDLVAKFASYGFNKSHAAAYALVAYHTAYMKANYVLEFFAATMTYDMANTDKLNQYRQELRDKNIPLLPPDINKSDVYFSVEYEPVGAVRYALAAIKGVGAEAMKALVRERNENGPFKSLDDFAARVGAGAINKRLMEALVRAGAFDQLEPNRATVYAGIETILKTATAAREEKSSSQIGLFGAIASGEGPKLQLANAKPWKLLEKLQHEFDVIGFYLSAHPMDMYAAGLKRRGAKPSDQLPNLVRTGKAAAKLAGTLTAKRESKTKKGDPFAFLSLSDQAGAFECTVFSELLKASREILNVGDLLYLECEAEMREGTLRLTAKNILPLAQAVADAEMGLFLEVQETQAFEQVKKLLMPLHKIGGRGGMVSLLLKQNGWDHEVEVELLGRYQIKPGMSDDFLAIPGVVAAREL